MKKVLSYCSVVVALLIVLAGCSKPPEMEMKAAQDAIKAANAAEAEMYVPESFRQAMDSLSAAEKSKKEQDGKSALSRNYAKSKDLYVAAARLAKKAAADAAGAKQAVQAEVGKMLTDARAALDKAAADMKKVKVNKKNKADIDACKADLANAETAYSNASAANTAGKFMDSKAQLNNVMAMCAALPGKVAMAGKSPAAAAPVKATKAAPKPAHKAKKAN